MIDVTVLLLDDGLPSTSVAPIEIFGNAGTLWGRLTGTPERSRFRVRTASLDGKRARPSAPLELVPMMSLAEVRRTDLVVVPAVGRDLGRALDRNRRLIDWLARRRPPTSLAGICSGNSLLAAAGLLDGGPATTHWAVVDECRARFPRVDWRADRFVTQHKNVFCGGGVYASIDLSLHLVEHFCGHEVAVETAKAMLLQTPRVFQTPYATAPPRSAHEDEPVQRAQDVLFRGFRAAIDLDRVAAQVGLSPRHFARRFKAATGEAPLAYLHRLRIDAARRELEREHASVQEVARGVGYEDLAFFRQLFRRHTGASPRDYRARFGPRVQPAPVPGGATVSQLRTRR